MAGSSSSYSIRFPPLRMLVLPRRCVRPRVGNESAVPRVHASGLFALFGGCALVMQLAFAGTEEIGLAAVSIGEDVIVVEDDIGVVKKVNDDRRVCNRQEAHRLRSSI